MSSNDQSAGGSYSAFEVGTIWIRKGDWWTDNSVVAHISMPIYGQLASQCTADGRWEPTPEGVVFLAPEDDLDLASEIHRFLDGTVQCELFAEEYNLVKDLDDVPMHIIRQQCSSLDEHGTSFNFYLAKVVPVLPAITTWRHKVINHGGVLVGLNANDEPVFGLASLSDREEASA